MAEDKINGAVFANGIRYSSGDEAKLRQSGIGGQAFQNLKTQRTNNGDKPIIEGFDDLLGTRPKKVTPSGLAADPTVNAREDGQKHYAHGHEMEPAFRDASELDEDEEEVKANPKKRRATGTTVGDPDEDEGVGPEDDAFTSGAGEETDEGETPDAPRRTRRRAGKGKRASK